MTKIEIIGHIKSLLPRIDKTTKYHDNVIAASIERVFNQFFYTMAVKNDREVDDYTVTTTETVAVADATTGIYATTLSKPIIPLPGKRSGVRAVYPKVQGEVTFYPMTKKEADLAPNTFLGLIGDRIGYIVRGETVEYYNMDATTQAAGVRMDLIVPFTDLADDDEVKYPYGFDTDIVSAVLEMSGLIPQVDLKDNNSDNG